MEKLKQKSLWGVIAAAAAGCVVFLWVIVHKSEPETVLALRDLPTLPADGQEQNKTPPLSLRTPAQNESRPKADKKAVLEKLRFAGKRLQTTAESLTLPLTVSWRLKCGGVDREVMKEFLKKKGESWVLVSIETLADRSPLAAQRLSLEQFFRGAELVLQIPLANGISEVGLFICTDSSAKGSCGGKEALSSKAAQQPAGLSRSGDHVLYFSYALFSGAYLYTFQDFPQNKEFAVVETLERKILHLEEQEIKNNLAELQRLYQIVIPKPLNLSGSSIRASLPLIPDSCSGMM